MTHTRKKVWRFAVEIKLRQIDSGSQLLNPHSVSLCAFDSARCQSASRCLATAVSCIFESACGACGEVSMHSIKAKKGIHICREFRHVACNCSMNRFSTEMNSMVLTSEAWHLSLPSRQSWITHNDTTKRDTEELVPCGPVAISC